MFNKQLKKQMYIVESALVKTAELTQELRLRNSILEHKVKTLERYVTLLAQVCDNNAPMSFKQLRDCDFKQIDSEIKDTLYNGI